MLDFQDLADLGFTVSISNLDNFAPMASKRIERRWLKRIAAKSCIGDGWPSRPSDSGKAAGES